MPNRKKSRRDLGEDEFKTCSFCGKSVSVEGFEDHLEKVHLGLDDDEDDDDEDDFEDGREVRRNRRSGNREKSKKGGNKKKAERRKQVERERRKKQDTAMFFGLLIVIGIIVIGYFMFAGPGGSDDDDITTLGVTETKVVPGTNEVRIPISDVDDGQAHYYYFDSNGVKVNYFLLKSSDGVIRAAFDTCDVCYGEKKGYRQEGDYMVCNNCGQRFASVNINEISGGCNPAKLERYESGGNVVITSDDIATGRWYFE